MNNFIQPGNVLTLTAPGGGVVSGKGYLISDLYVVAANTVGAGLPFPAMTAGVVEIDKLTSDDWAEGEMIFRDDSTGKATSADGSGANVPIGYAAAAAGANDVTGKVLLAHIMTVTLES